MKKTTVVLIAIIVAIATFLLTSALLPREASAPTTKNAPEGSVIIPMNIVSQREMSSSSPTISIEYPQFPSLSAALNDEIASATMSRLTEFRSNVADNEQARQATASEYPSAAIPMSEYSFLASWQPAQINSRYVSFVERYDSFSGGANENEELQTFNFDITANKDVALKDLFPSSPNYLNQVSQSAREQLASTLAQSSDGNTPTEMIDGGTTPDAANFKNFTFTDYSVTFYFPKYAVAPGSFGEQKVDMPKSAVK